MIRAMVVMIMLDVKNRAASNVFHGSSVNMSDKHDRNVSDCTRKVEFLIVLSGAENNIHH